MGMWHFEAINIGADSSGRETERQLAARFFPEVSQLKFRSESLSTNREYRRDGGMRQPKQRRALGRS